MSKHLKPWAPALVAVLATLVVVAGYDRATADPTEPEPRTVIATTPTGDTTDLRTIHGTGTGRVRGTPDTMTIDIGVSARSESAEEAMANARDKANQVFAALRDGGVEERDIQTTSFYVTPVFDDNGEQVTGYEVANTVTATLHDLDRAGKVIDAAARVGGDSIRIDGVWFSIEDTSDLVAAARAEAVERARAQAEQLAAAAGLELGDILSIEETSAPADPPVDYYAEDAEGRASAPETPINPGTQELYVDVTVTFAIR
jgi:uncharacterized protein